MLFNEKMPGGEAEKEKNEKIRKYLEGILERLRIRYEEPEPDDMEQIGDEMEIYLQGLRGRKKEIVDELGMRVDDERVQELNEELEIIDGELELQDFAGEIESDNFSEARILDYDKVKQELLRRAQEIEDELEMRVDDEHAGELQKELEICTELLRLDKEGEKLLDLMKEIIDN